MDLQPPHAPAEAPLLAPLPPPRYRSLRLQLTLTFGLLVTTLAAVATLFVGDWARDRMQWRASEALHLVGRNAARLLADGLNERLRGVQMLASMEVLWKDGLGSASVHAWLDRMQRMQPHHLWIGVADEAGMVRAATGGLLVGRKVQDPVWLQEGLRAPYVGDVHTSRLLGTLLPPNRQGEPQRFLDFAAPIVQDGRTAGVLCLHGSWDWVTDVIEGLLPPDTLFTPLQVFVFNRQGELIYAPGGKWKAFAGLGQQMPELAVSKGGGAQLVRWKDQQEPLLTTAIPLPARQPATDLGWRIVVRQPMTAIQADARHVMGLVMLAGLAAALGSVVAAVLLARRMGSELQALTQAAHDIQGGALDTRVPEAHSTSELQGLSQAMAGMVEQMAQSHGALERQVQERNQQLWEAREEMERRAGTDPLTGLLNRRSFQHQMGFALALARRSGRPLALLLLDIDHFEPIHATRGREAGDQVLKELGQLLQLRLRESDMVARLDDEAFVVVLPDTSREAALQTAESLRGMVAEHSMPAIGHITVSIGVSMLPLGAPDAASVLQAQLLHRSDQALQAAKRQGGNQVQASPDAER